jgi:WD40 repeat protein
MRYPALVLLALATACAAASPILVPQTGLQLALYDSAYLMTYRVAFSPDGKTLALVSENAIVLYDMPTGTEKGLLVGHDLPVYALAFSPDGKTLTSSGTSTQLREQVIVWNLLTGKSSAAAARNAAPPEVSPAERRRSLARRASALSRDGKTLATLSRSGLVFVRDRATGRRKYVLDGRADRIVGILFSPDGRTLATVGRDGAAALWDAATGARRCTLAGSSTSPDTRGGVGCDAAFSPDGKVFATSGADRVLLWNTATGQREATLGPDVYTQFSIAFSPDGKTLATQGPHGAALWNLATRKEQHILAYPMDVTFHPALSPDGRFLALPCGNALMTWDVNLGERKQVLVDNSDRWTIDTALISPDDRIVVAEGTETTERADIRWDLAAGKQVPPPPDVAGHPRQPWEPPGIAGEPLAFSPEGGTIATGWGSAVVLWDTATSGKRRELNLGTASPRFAAFSSDGETVATAGALWDVATGERRVELEGNVFGDNLVFSPDGKTVLGGALCEPDDTVVLVWDATTGKRLRTIAGPPSAVSKVFLSRDGKTLAATSATDFNGYGMVVTVVDATTGMLRRMYDHGRTDVIDDAVAGPDAEVGASLLRDHGIRLWDLTTGRTRATLYSFDTGKAWLIVTPEGYYTGSDNIGDHICWRVGDTMYPGDKFAAQYHRPDLVAASLSRRN